MSKQKEDTFTITKLSLWKGISTFMAVLLLVSIYTGGFGTRDGVAPAAEKAAAPAAPAAQPSAPAADKQDVDMTVLMDDDSVKGNENAPVTIVEWSDFECPFCVRFYSQAYAQIKSEYIDTGKVKIVFRDFPLGFHAQAQKAAEAAECAGEQDDFWGMHDKLFEEGVAGGVATFKKYAKDLGLDSSKFDACLDNGDMAAEVAKDMQDGQRAGIRGTPGFIINGQLVSGAQPFEAFKQVIDAALAE
ncbi:MAG: DsbA family protein [Candidatus Woesearchaeota archaeon]